MPGRRLSEDGEPIEPDAESVRIARSGVVLRVEDSIIGAVRLANESTAHISNSIVDATHPSKVACAGTGADGAYTADGSLTLLATTVIGKVRVHQMPLVSNSILLARRTGPDDPWREPVRVTRRQEGCVRFSYVPLRAVTPRRFRCQPQLAIEAEIARRERDGVHLRAAMKARIANGLGRSLVPSFTAHRYGRPAYCQLLRSTPLEIRAGADDEAEMGAFHDLYQPQRETNLVVRLDEYLRLGLEAGEFFET